MIRYLFITLFALATVASSAQSNLALGKTASASSGTASLAVDGNTGTRWESAQGNDDEWWSVDLGTAQEFDMVQILWEGAYAKSFDIVAANKADFSDAVTIVSKEGVTLEGAFPKTLNYEFEAVTKRYIKFVGVARGTNYGYSFYEFAAYKKTAPELTALTVSAAANVSKVGKSVGLSFSGTDQYGNAFDVDAVTWTVSPADGGTIADNTFTPSRMGEFSISAQKGAISSNTITVVGYEGTNVASADKVIAYNEEAAANKAFAFDGNEDGDPWLLYGATGETEENRTYTTYFTLDLGKDYNLRMVSVCFEGASSAAYTIQTSTDNVTWKTAATVNHADGIKAWKDRLIELNNSLGVRYVKFESTKAATQYGVKVREFAVYANAVGGDLVKENAADAQTGTYYMEGVLNATTRTFFDSDNAVAYDLRNVTIPAALTIEAQNPNAMFLVTEAQKTLLAGTKNLVVKDGSRYVSDNITLTDGYDVNTKLTIEATNASYTRAASTGYKTLVLPFNASIPSGAKAYQLIDKVTSGVLFQEADQLVAGTPYLIIGANALNPSATNVTLNFAVNADEGDDATMTATYTATTAGAIGGNVYILDDANQFRKAAAEATIPAFRAYITSEVALSKLAVLFDETDGIEGLMVNGERLMVNGEGLEVRDGTAYDLQGRRIAPATPLRKGLYIVNGKKTVVR